MGTSQYGRITTDGGKVVSLTIRRMTAGYFEALGLDPLQGRLPTVEEYASGRPVAIVNQRAAKQLFPDGPAAGRVITLGNQQWR
jgi:hypothetical protein